ncbi:MAG: hypothetical protein KJ645_08925 [Planctomycetes bacterium]|nr:hypothetical protein [Planctomycetota bacterium]
MSRIALFTVLSLLWGGASSLAQMRTVPAAGELETFETPHFRFIHQKSLEEAAPVVAGYCEEAFDVLEQIFHWTPAGKIDVLFLDALDTHNGWATVIPHKMLALFAAGTDPGSGIDLPGNLLRRTVFHEMTHIFTMDTAYGYAPFFAGIFGRVLPFDLLSGVIFFLTTPPGALVPRWVQEGISIWIETRFAPPGRGRSSYADMIFRCAAEAGDLLPMEKWYIELPHWPYGQAPYLYGMKFFQHLQEKEREAPAAFMEQVAHAILFHINPAAIEAGGKGLKPLAGDMLKIEKQRQLKALDQLRLLTVTETPRLTPEAISVYSPWYAGERIFFLGQEEERRSTLYGYDPSSESLEKIGGVNVTPGSGNLTATVDDHLLYYNRLEILDRDHLWFEVRRFDPVRNRDTLITREGRYRAIDVAPDGQRMAAVSQISGKSRLFELSLDNEGLIMSTRELYHLPFPREIASPRYDPAGRRIVFVEYGDEGYALSLYHPDTGKVERVFESPHLILSPVWHPTKDSVVFSHDANGVFNLYEIALGALAAPRALTHVTGGLFYPAFSPNGDRLAAVGFDGAGPFLTTLPYDPERLAGKALPKIAPFWKEEDGESNRGAGVASGNTGADRVHEDRAVSTDEIFKDPAFDNLSVPEKYNSLRHLRFDYWSPWALPSARGVQGGVGASFSDPTGYQNLMLLAGVESRYHSPVAAFNYTYSGFYPDIHLYAEAEQNYFNNLIVQRNSENRFDYAEEAGRFGLAVNVQLLRMEHRIHLESGYEYRTRKGIDRVAEDYSGRTITLAPTREDEGSVWARVSYFDGTAFKRGFSVEDGRLISLGAERSAKGLGGELARARYLAEWDEYIPMPGLKNHTLKLAAAYGKGSGDRFAQGHFTLGGLAGPIAGMTPGLPAKLNIRGYPDNFQVGESAVRAAAAYRFPIYDFSKGTEGVFPVYSHQVFGELFYEGGRTWDPRGNGDDLEWINSFGGEVNFALKLLRVLQIAPGIGVAHIPQRADRRDSNDRWTAYITLKAWVSF